MIAIVLDHLATALASTATFAASEGEGGPAWLLILGPAGAGGVYFGLFRYYRNTQKSHSFESETRIEAQSVTGNDTKTREITGTKKSGIDGDNRSNHRRRVQRLP